MAILMAVGASTLTSNMNSMQMIQAIETTRHQFERARQYAMTHNCRTEVRLYHMQHESADDTAWNALEIGTIKTTPSELPTSLPEENFQPVETLNRLPIGYAFHPDLTFSTLLGATGIRTGTQDAAQSPDNRPRNYAAFQFRPDGRCTLGTSSSWTLTLIKKGDLASPTTLPPNFATLELDAATARLRLYRP